MLTLRKSSDRGHADYGWLDTYHTFSFANYQDPQWMSFGPLRVLNQDRVEAGHGFGTHPHADMEIVSYVLDGTMAHEDSMGNGSTMVPGDVQLMSAGTGVMHSEFNASKEDALHFLQMWIIPAAKGTKPRYEQKHFGEETRAGTLKLLVSPDGEGDSLKIGQDAWLYGGKLASGDEASQALADGRRAWLHVATGSVTVNSETLETGDGVAIEGEPEVVARGVEAAEVVMWVV